MRWIGDGFWWMTILNQGAMLFTIPIMILLGWAFIYPNRRLWLALLPCLLVLGLVLGPYALPYRTAAHPKTDLRIMTYNVLYSNSHPEAIAAVIMRIDADLILLQEVQPAMMKALVDQLASRYPYAMMAAEHPYGTTAAFSRWPVTEARDLDLQADRHAVLLRVQTPKMTITVIAAHLLAFNIRYTPLVDWPATIDKRVKDQEGQVRNLLQLASDYPHDPLILGCDCNSTEFANSARLLSTTFRNVAHEIGWAVPPGPQPGSRADIRPNHIDYVWYRGGLQAQATYLWNEHGGSDHAPLVAEFTWK